MDTHADHERILTRLANTPPSEPRSDVAKTVKKHRGLLIRALRKGHSLDHISEELRIPKKTLQRHLNEAGIFLRKPRKNKGSVVRPYRTKNMDRNSD